MMKVQNERSRMSLRASRPSMVRAVTGAPAPLGGVCGRVNE